MQLSRFVTLSILFGAAWGSSCSSQEAAPRASAGSAPAASSTAGRGQNLDDLSLAGKNSGVSPSLNPLCGSAVDCNPDSTSACENFVSPNASGGSPATSTGGAPSGGQPAVSGGGSSGGATSGGTSTSGGTQATSGLAGAAGSSGTAGRTAGAGMSAAGAGQAGSLSNAGAALSAGVAAVTPPTFDGSPPTGDYACRVQRGAKDQARASCAPAGVGALDNPCGASRDCAPGLACVGDTALARCRHFCCGGADVCSPGTYCSEQPLRESSEPAGAPALQVPVCVAADNCDLGEPFPCPPGRGCTCSEGRACSVVRPDGTTSCVVPGKGLAGAACPCAAGHICSQGSLRCLKLCKTTDVGQTCGLGRCQATAELPTSYGVCVGLDGETGRGGAGGEAGSNNP